MHPNQLDAFMALHQQVAAKTSFIKARSMQSLCDHFANGHTGITLFDDSGKMVAQALLTFPDMPGATNIDFYPLHFGAQNTAIIQSVGIHPAHTGQGLSAKLFNIATQLTHNAGRTHLLAKTNAANIGAQKSFQKAGFAHTGTPSVIGADPYASSFMLKDLVY